MRVCLDSWAVLAWLDGDEPAAEAVQETFDAGRPWMSWLNVGEVAYQLERRHGAEDAALVIGRLRAIARDAPLFTGDPEMLERDLGCVVCDLRPSSS